MWVFALGRYQITKQKKDGFYFRLQSKELNGEYRIYNTGGKNWLCERLDVPQIDYLRNRVEFMLSESRETPPKGDEFLYEIKWDGIRAMISLDEGQVRILSRNGKDISSSFPELTAPEESFRATNGLFDGEIVCLEKGGKPDFKNVIHRMQQTSETSVARARAKHPAICYIFDCLYLDGRPIVGETLERRRVWLKDAVKSDSSYRVSDVVDEGAELFRAASAMGLEGIMAKQRTSTYQPGKRSPHWLKIKTRHTMDCVIIGYTKGKGTRDYAFGAIHVAEATKGGLRYVGKVGTGFDDKMLKSLYNDLKKLKEIKRPIKEKPLDDGVTTWVESKLMCEVQYASFTKDGMLREPVFVRLRPDL
jgi:DNA ligase D-like protein (predicted ligase)